MIYKSFFIAARMLFDEQDLFAKMCHGSRRRTEMLVLFKCVLQLRKSSNSKTFLSQGTKYDPREVI